MRARQLELLIADRCARSETDLDVRGRRLREAMYVPSGGRGPHAPQVDARIAATIVIAAFGAEQAIDAVSGVTTFAPMVAIGESFGGSETFGDAIETALGNLDLAARIRRVEFIRYFKGFVSGVVEWTSTDQTIERAVYLPEEQADAFRSGRLDVTKLGAASGGKSLFIGGGLIQEIALELVDEEVAGYAD